MTSKLEFKFKWATSRMNIPKTLMSNQEMLNKVVEHFIVDPHPPGIEVKTMSGREVKWLCRLRTTDGRKCAIGMFIPDSTYSSYMEDQSLAKLASGLGETIVSQDVGFLWTLRQAHDRWAALEGISLEAELREVARRFGLNFPAL